MHPFLQRREERQRTARRDSAPAPRPPSPADSPPPLRGEGDDAFLEEMQQAGDMTREEVVRALFEFDMAQERRNGRGEESPRHAPPPLSVDVLQEAASGSTALPPLPQPMETPMRTRQDRLLRQFLEPQYDPSSDYISPRRMQEKRDSHRTTAHNSVLGWLDGRRGPMERPPSLTVRTKYTKMHEEQMERVRRRMDERQRQVADVEAQKAEERLRRGSAANSGIRRRLEQRGSIDVKGSCNGDR